MTLAIQGPITRDPGPMTLAIGWPHDPGENVGRWPHVPGDRQPRTGREVPDTSRPNPGPGGRCQTLRGQAWTGREVPDTSRPGPTGEVPDTSRPGPDREGGARTGRDVLHWGRCQTLRGQARTGREVPDTSRPNWGGARHLAADTERCQTLRGPTGLLVAGRPDLGRWPSGRTVSARAGIEHQPGRGAQRMGAWSNAEVRRKIRSVA